MRTVEEIRHLVKIKNSLITKYQKAAYLANSDAKRKKYLSRVKKYRNEISVLIDEWRYVVAWNYSNLDLFLKRKFNIVRRKFTEEELVQLQKEAEEWSEKDNA